MNQWQGLVIWGVMLWAWYVYYVRPPGSYGGISALRGYEIDDVLQRPTRFAVMGVALLVMIIAQVALLFLGRSVEVWALFPFSVLTLGIFFTLLVRFTRFYKILQAKGYGALTLKLTTILVLANKSPRSLPTLEEALVLPGCEASATSIVQLLKPGLGGCAEN